jgi:hypothetical protein
MSFQFTKHYTREEARALLPQVRQWLEKLDHMRAELEKHERRLERLMASRHDVGGDTVNSWIRILADTREVLLEFQTRQILIKDVDRGLVDFPAIVAGKEVFLCWEKGEEDIEFWHDLDTGYSGRERL